MSYPPQDEYDQQPAHPGQPQQGWGVPQGYPQQPYPQQGQPGQPFPQQAYPGQPMNYASPTMVPLDNSGRAKTAFVLLLILAGMAVLQLLAGVASALLIDFDTMTQFQDPDPGTLPSGTVLGALIAAGCLGLLFFVLWIVSIVFYMMWQHRAFHNARAMGQQTTFSPGWSVGWWFIPFANLVLIGLVLRDLWKATAGRGAGGALPNLIWAALLFQVVLAIGSGVMNTIALETGNSSLYHASNAVGIAGSLLSVVFWAMLASFVRRVQVAQAGGQ